MAAGDGHTDTVLEATFVKQAEANLQVARMEGRLIDKVQHEHTHELAAEKVARLQGGRRFHRMQLKVLEADFKEAK